MVKEHKQRSKLDRLGITASTLCAIHCAITPVLFTSLPLIGLGFLANHWIEWGMIILALVIGAYSSGSAFLVHHRNVWPVVLLLVGFSLICGGHLWLSGWAEAIMAPAGGLSIALAHVINIKLSDTCKIPTHNHKLQIARYEKS